MASRLPAFASVLARSARPALVSVRAARAPPAFRQLGAFAPTQSLLKKRAVAAEEDAFEEDDFDDFEQSTQTDDIPADSARPTGANREAHFQAKKAALEAALNQSHFQLRSNLPPASALLSVLSSASADELPLALQLLAKWRARGLAIPPSTLPTLASTAARTRSPHSFVAALVNRTAYGLDLPSPAHADSIALRLSAPRVNRAGEDGGVGRKSVKELTADLEAVEQLRRAVRLAGAGRVDPVAAVCAASLAARVEGQDELAAKRVKEARSAGDEVLLARAQELRRPDQKQLQYRLHRVAQWAEAKGDKAAAAWAAKVHDALRA